MKKRIKVEMLYKIPLTIDYEKYITVSEIESWLKTVEAKKYRFKRLVWESSSFEIYYLYQLNNNQRRYRGLPLQRKSQGERNHGKR